MLEPRGKHDCAIVILSYILRTGFLMYMNTPLLLLFSKEQSTVETLVLGTEFIAMKQGIDALRGLRY